MNLELSTLPSQIVVHRPVEVVQVGQDVGAAYQFPDASETQAAQNFLQLPGPGIIEVADAVGSPLDGHQVHQLLVSGGDAPGAAPAALAVVAAEAFQGHQVGGADLDRVGPQGDGLGDVVGGADAAGGDEGDVVPCLLYTSDAADE